MTAVQESPIPEFFCSSKQEILQRIQALEPGAIAKFFIPTEEFGTRENVTEVFRNMHAFLKELKALGKLAYVLMALCPRNEGDLMYCSFAVHARPDRKGDSQ